jgi:hypothetical protein
MEANFAAASIVLAEAVALALLLLSHDLLEAVLDLLQQELD